MHLLTTPLQQRRARTIIIAMKRLLLILAIVISAAPLCAETGCWYTAMEPEYFTASGTLFDDSKKGAASDTLPLGTVVELSNAVTGTSTITTITDTLPELPEGRTIALTRAAAEDLRMMDRGLGDIKVSIVREGTISREKNEDTGWYKYDLGVFEDTAQAAELYFRLIENGLMPYATAEDNGIRLEVRHVLAYQMDETVNRIALSGIEAGKAEAEDNPYI